MEINNKNNEIYLDPEKLLEKQNILNNNKNIISSPLLYKNWKSI